MVEQKYNWPDEIPDEAIREQFAAVDTISFSARRFNTVGYRQVGVGDLGWWIPFERFLKVINITPDQLRPVFNQSPELRPKRFSLISRLLHQRQHTEKYDQLGSFALGEKPFIELAKVLGKSIEVLRENGGTGEHYYLFTATPAGEIVEKDKKPS